MLAADRLLLETNLRQSAIKLREKELNLFTNNFSALGTQAAVLAGFTTTCFIEISLPETVHVLAKSLIHIFAVISICANITCVSLSTIVSVWGSAKALRGKDGSMDDAVDGMSAECDIIFKAFGLGLAGNLCTVLAACWILMEAPLAFLATIVISYAAWTILTNFFRIRKRFQLNEVVALDDLTRHSASDRMPPTISQDKLGLTNRKLNNENV
mmetsp:Transcript_17367/g.17453  ORF Transcript_17367/g.17453 Transcript_17367/m.17453 type:complete len:213 (+) Transcript_17367:230-868(+)